MRILIDTDPSEGAILTRRTLKGKTTQFGAVVVGQRAVVISSKDTATESKSELLEER